jgi:hypothetical protein
MQKSALANIRVGAPAEPRLLGVRRGPGGRKVIGPVGPDHATHSLCGMSSSWALGPTRSRQTKHSQRVASIRPSSRIDSLPPEHHYAYSLYAARALTPNSKAGVFFSPLAFLLCCKNHKNNKGDSIKEYNICAKILGASVALDAGDHTAQ